MMTEEVARKKWCPMARVIPVRDGKHSGQPPFNRGAPDGVDEIILPPAAYCVASICALWVEDTAIICPGCGNGKWGSVNEKDERLCSQCCEPVEKVENIGHCGLAR